LFFYEAVEAVARGWHAVKMTTHCMVVFDVRRHPSELTLERLSVYNCSKTHFTQSGTLIMMMMMMMIMMTTVCTIC